MSGNEVLVNLLRRATVVAVVSISCALGGAARGAAAATHTALYVFPRGVWPLTGLVSGPGGALYGATNSTIYQLTQTAAGHWQEKTIFGTGAYTLVGSATALYAATNTGNTVFELLPPAKGSTVWKGTVLHVFRGDKDGSQPLGLTLAPDGSLYGTTQLGGGAPACGSQNGVPTGCGTLFRLSQVNGKWSELLIHAFQAGADGAIPVASPSLDSAGNLYMTTSEGGLKSTKLSGVVPALMPSFRSPRDTTGGCGELIGLANSLDYDSRDVYDFCKLFGDGDEYFPESLVIAKYESSKMFPFATAAANQLILTTTGGGDQSKFCLNTSFDGCGIIAEFTRTSSTTKPWDAKIIHRFSGPDGFSPLGYLTSDGTTEVFGVAGSAIGNCPDQGCGEIFALEYGKTGWAWGGVVYRFTTDAFPVPQLTLYKGKLLGTTSGYNVSLGTIYELTP
jgi:hypothetical protein